MQSTPIYGRKPREGQRDGSACEGSLTGSGLGASVESVGALVSWVGKGTTIAITPTTTSARPPNTGAAKRRTNGTRSTNSRRLKG